MREGHAGFIKRVSEKARKSFPQISPPGQTGVALCLAGSKSSSQLFHNLLTVDFLVTPSKKLSGNSDATAGLVARSEQASNQNMKG
jgi:hypothetical protein